MQLFRADIIKIKSQFLRILLEEKVCEVYVWIIIARHKAQFDARGLRVLCCRIPCVSFQDDRIDPITRRDSTPSNVCGLKVHTCAISTKFFVSIKDY